MSEPVRPKGAARRSNVNPVPPRRQRGCAMTEFAILNLDRIRCRTPDRRVMFTFVKVK